HWGNHNSWEYKITYYLAPLLLPGGGAAGLARDAAAAAARDAAAAAARDAAAAAARDAAAASAARDAGNAAGLAAEDAGAAAVNTSRDLGMDPATGAFRQGEYETAIRIQQERGVVLQRSADPGVDWVDAKNNTYDAVGNFSSKYFDRQWPNLQT